MAEVIEAVAKAYALLVKHKRRSFETIPEDYKPRVAELTGAN